MLSNVPVKSKLQDTLGQPPGNLNFWKVFVQILPSPDRKAVQMPPPSRKLPDYCPNFSEASIMLLKLCMCKHGLLDNTLTCHEILGIFHINISLTLTSSMNSPWLYFTSSGQDNWRPSCKKGVYRILADFHFLQDRANFWQTDLLLMRSEAHEL